MLILAFESSAKAGSVALLQDGMLLADYFQNGGQTHSRTLNKMAEDMLTNCDLTPKDVDAVACAAGPGSFTGVRIGLSAAKGFAWAGELPCYGVSTLQAMAHSVMSFEGIVCACMDARRSQVYNALFLAEGGKLTRIAEDRAIALADLKEELINLQKPIFLVGDGANLCYNTLSKDVPNLILPPEHRIHQRAVGVAILAQRLSDAGVAPSGGELTPNYLRLSQAEREKLERENKN